MPKVPVLFVISLLLLDIFLLQEVPPPAIFPPFRALDSDGNFVTNEIFAGKLTAVCVYGTSAEFVESLAALKKNLPPDVQILGIANSAAAQILAKKIAPSIPQILANDTLAPILTKIKIAPTTLFVDAQGKLVGQAVSGAEIILVQREIARILEMNSPRTQALQKIQASIFR